MAIKALTLTSGWQSALAQFRQLAATARAPLILPGKVIALDMTERVIVAAMFGQFGFRTLSSYWQILLQKSKIERCRKSRESRFLDTATVAGLCSANVQVRGQFCAKQ